MTASLWSRSKPIQACREVAEHRRTPSTGDAEGLPCCKLYRCVGVDGAPARGDAGAGYPICSSTDPRMGNAAGPATATHKLREAAAAAAAASADDAGIMGLSCRGGFATNTDECTDAYAFKQIDATDITDV